ncbi:hypothetical protein EGN25_05910, partial [Enterococcus faecium]|nr:hypothetical protein [Enterococcus faecium]
NKVISPLFFLFPNIFILSLFIYYEKEMRLRGEVTTKFLKKKYIKWQIDVLLMRVRLFVSLDFYIR